MNARVVKSGPLARAAVATAIGLALGSAALVWTRTEITTLRYEQVRLLEAEARLRDEVEKLRLEAAVLRAPERIEARARRLGLVDPRPGQIARAPARGSRP